MGDVAASGWQQIWFGLLSVNFTASLQGARSEEEFSYALLSRIIYLPQTVGACMSGGFLEFWGLIPNDVRRKREGEWYQGPSSPLESNKRFLGYNYVKKPRRKSS